jgi:hypothetical protein
MYTTRLNSKEIDLFLEICYNKKTNRLNEDIFKKLKQGSSRIAKSLSRKFDEIKRAFKNPESWRGFLNWLKTHRSKIRNLTLITTASTLIIACNTGFKSLEDQPLTPSVEEPNEVKQTAIETAIESENIIFPGNIGVLEYEFDEDGVAKINRVIDTRKWANTNTGYLGPGVLPAAVKSRSGQETGEFSLGLIHSHEVYSLSRVSSQFGNILDDIQGIFFYNKTIESDLVNLISNVKADFGGKKLKNKKYIETIRLKDKEYKAFYLVYESWRDKNENTSVLKNFLKSWKESVLEGNTNIELAEKINALAERIYDCAIDADGATLGGFVCSGSAIRMLREISPDIKSYKPHLLPAIISFNESHAASSIDDIIIHETGHMIFDNKYVSKLIDNIIYYHGDSSVTKKQFQKTILKHMSLVINTSTSSNSLGTKLYSINDLPESIIKKIQNTVKCVSGLMLSSGQIKITNDNIEILERHSNYMSKHNEFIQHINDRTRRLGRLLELFKLKDNPEKLNLLMKSIIDSDKLLGKLYHNTTLSYEIASLLDHYVDYKTSTKMKYTDNKNKKMSLKHFKRYKKAKIKTASDYFEKSWQKVLAEYKKVQEPGATAALEKDLLDSILSVGNKENLKKLIKWIQGLGQLSNGHASDLKTKKQEVEGYVSLIIKLERLIRGNKAEKTIVEKGLVDVSDLAINSKLLSLVIEELVIDASFVESFMNATPEIQDKLEASLSDKQKEAFNKVFSGTTGENYFEINESVHSFHKIKEAVFYRLLIESYV